MINKLLHSGAGDQRRLKNLTSTNQMCNRPLYKANTASLTAEIICPLWSFVSKFYWQFFVLHKFRHFTMFFRGFFWAVVNWSWNQCSAKNIGTKPMTKGHDGANNWTQQFCQIKCSTKSHLDFYGNCISLGRSRLLIRILVD